MSEISIKYSKLLNKDVKLDIPKNTIFVIPKKIISIKKQIEFFNIKSNVNIRKIKNIIRTPKNPYWIKFNDGKKYLGKSPSECKKIIKRGLTVEEGIAIITQHPSILKNHAIDLIGSVYGKECIPTVYFWKCFYLSVICPDVKDIKCGTGFAIV